MRSCFGEEKKFGKIRLNQPSPIIRLSSPNRTEKSAGFSMRFYGDNVIFGALLDNFACFRISIKAEELGKHLISLGAPRGFKELIPLTQNVFLGAREEQIELPIGYL